MQKLEKMDDFFAARVQGYDEHMLSEVEGCKEGYAEMARMVPAGCKTLLDLGCGTGLELDEIFKLFPSVSVTGIDLTAAMLGRLRQKHPDKSMKLICGDYFAADFGSSAFDCAVSFQTMHHFEREKKTGLYKKIYDSLVAGGVYIECDYMVETQAEEDLWQKENLRLRAEAGVAENELCHYDIPYTVENQLSMMKAAGFLNAEKTFRLGNTTIIIARR